MPPKKKAGGKAKGKGSGLGGIIDGVDTSQMSREQLEVFSKRIKEENEREREERNYFQLERDKLHNFWEITRKEIEEVQAKLRNKDREIEEANEKNEEEIKVYKQKVKLLQYEHQNSLTESKAQSLVALKVAQDEYTFQENELIKDKNELKAKLREQETSHLEQVKALKLHYCEKITIARDEFEKRTKEFEVNYRVKLEEVIENFKLKHRMELSEVEERKNTQIEALLKNHEAVFGELKNYYNDITLNNLALISSLKDQVEVLTKQNDKMRKDLSNMAAENAKLGEPLKNAEKEVVEYKKQLENYKKDKLSLSNIKAKYFDIKKAYEELRWSNDALELRYENLEVEKENLHTRYQQAILNFHQKMSLKNAILEKKMQSMGNVVEYRDAIFADEEVPSSSPEAPPYHISKKYEDLLENKSTTIKGLQDELNKVCKSYNDLLDLCKEKFGEYGISEDELSFIPLKIFTEEDQSNVY